MRREPAWRVLAGEIVASGREEKGSAAREASFLVSPFGARMSRVLLAGELGPATSVGRDPAQPFWRAPLADPTGSVPITAGGFQPRALAGIQQFLSPGPAVVLGKVHLYQGRDDRAIASIRAEEIRPASLDEVLEVQNEGRESTLARLGLVEQLRSTGDANAALPAVSRAPPLWVEGARAALEAYSAVERSAYRGLLAREFRPPTSTPAPREGAGGRVTISPVPPAASRSRAGPVNHEQESVFLDLVDELSEGSSDGYADLRDAVQLAGGRGLTEHRVEEIVGALEESGVLEEPIIGKLRRA
ncbi:MAG TPA: hypothetical protein VGV89_05170 [Thermoplasmata archaeon]|nr:hypothetical protein [Thermoplasmata archaeon]